jgi:hypothetical protein
MGGYLRLWLECDGWLEGGICPPSRLRRYGATSFAWLAEPKLTLRKLA